MELEIPRLLPGLHSGGGAGAQGILCGATGILREAQGILCGATVILSEAKDPIPSAGKMLRCAQHDTTLCCLASCAEAEPARRAFLRRAQGIPAQSAGHSCPERRASCAARLSS